jgi:hypothetical protein
LDRFKTIIALLPRNFVNRDFGGPGFAEQVEQLPLRLWHARGIVRTLEKLTYYVAVARLADAGGKAAANSPTSFPRAVQEQGGLPQPPIALAAGGGAVDAKGQAHGQAAAHPAAGASKPGGRVGVDCRQGLAGGLKPGEAHRNPHQGGPSPLGRGGRGVRIPLSRMTRPTVARGRLSLAAISWTA